MPCVDISLQGFDRNKGRIIDVPLSFVLAKNSLACTTTAQQEVTVASSKEDAGMLGPGSYILSDPEPETLSIGVGPEFSKVSGQLHASVILNDQYLEIVNKTGITIVFSLSIVADDNISASINNSMGIASANDPIVVFTGSTLTYAEIDLYLCSTREDNCTMTGSITIITSVAVDESVASKNILITNNDYPTINLNNGSSTYIIDNSGLGKPTYMTIIGRPYDYTTVGITVYSGGPVYMLNSTGTPMTMGLELDGTLYKGTLAGGVFPGFPISSSFTSTARFSSLVDDTGNIPGIVADIGITTSSSVIPFSGNDGSLTSISIAGPTVVVGNVNNIFYNAPGANTIVLDTTIIDSIMLSTAVYYAGGSIQFVNNTGVPVIFVSYSTITNSPYMTLDLGASGTPPDIQGTSGVVAMNIISGGIAGIAVYYHSATAISPPPMIYIGSNPSGDMVPIPDNNTNNIQNVMINNNELYGSLIPISTPYPYTLLYAGSTSRPQLFNFSTVPIDVKYSNIVQTVPPNTAMSTDPLLVGSISISNTGSIKQVLDTGVPIVLLGEVNYNIYTNNFDNNTGIYSPTLDSLKVPISTMSYDDNVTIVLPPLSNTQPIIMTVFRSVYDVAILNNTGYVLSISSMTPGQDVPDAIIVNTGETFIYPSAYMTSMYIPPATGSPLQIMIYSNV